MPFDHDAEAKEPLSIFEVFFNSGRDDNLPIGPSAYIAVCSPYLDRQGFRKITSTERSYEALANQVEHLKALLDACLADIKARFAASNGAPV